MSDLSKKVSNSRERLGELMEYYHINQSELCRKTGLQKSALSNYLNGDRVPRLDQISLIVDCFNINPAWLMGYDVPMGMSVLPRVDPQDDTATTEALKVALKSLEDACLVIQVLLADNKTKEKLRNMITLSKSGVKGGFAMSKGDRLRQLREQIGMSQVEAAEKIGVSKQTLYKYEKDIVTNIPSDVIEKMAVIYNTTPAYLMGWSEQVRQIQTQKDNLCRKYISQDKTN